jgi:hypothetical protein
MNKKIMSITLILLILVALETVFAQVCLSKSAAQIRNKETKLLLVVNVMRDQAMNVEIKWKNGKNKWVYLAPLEQKTVEVPKGTSYKDHEVWSCE